MKKQVEQAAVETSQSSPNELGNEDWLGTALREGKAKHSKAKF
jgi:hypothetical protein